MLRGPFEWGVACAIVTVCATISGWYAADWLRASERAATGPPVRRVLSTDKALVPPVAPETARRVEAPRRTWYRFVGVRGDSWIQVRAAGPHGRVLYDGTLARGTAVRFRERALWVRFGAGSNVNLRVAGHRVALPLFGTFDAYLTRRGLVPDAVFHPDALQATAAQSP